MGSNENANPSEENFAEKSLKYIKDKCFCDPALLNESRLLYLQDILLDGLHQPCSHWDDIKTCKQDMPNFYLNFKDGHQGFVRKYIKFDPHSRFCENTRLSENSRFSSLPKYCKYI